MTRIRIIYIIAACLADWIVGE